MTVAKLDPPMAGLNDLRVKDDPVAAVASSPLTV